MFIDLIFHKDPRIYYYDLLNLFIFQINICYIANYNNVNNKQLEYLNVLGINIFFNRNV
jgi:hypothetical protein